MQETQHRTVEAEDGLKQTPSDHATLLSRLLPPPKRLPGGWYEIPSGHTLNEYPPEYFKPPEFVEHEIDAEREKHLEPDPYWAELGKRGEGAQALFDVGLKKKAYRYADCEVRAEKGECESFPGEHKFYKRYHCLNRFCEYCSRIHWGRLRRHYEPSLVIFLRHHDMPSGYTLALVTLSMRCNGEVPTRKQVRAFNQAIRKTVRRAVRRILKVRAARSDEWAASALKSRKATYGFLFSDEVGFETHGHIPDSERKAHGLNVHGHGLLYVPFLTDWREGWEIFRDTWREETQRIFGEESHGCYIEHLKGWQSNPVPAIKRALNYLLKYVSKCPYETMQRMAELELAFDRTRRVHAGGLWHGLKEPEPQHRGSGYCPLCKKEGRQSALRFHRRLLPTGREIPEYWPVDALEADGYRDLEKVCREFGFNPYEFGGGDAPG
jgi:Arc/MetJ family transcription regulator